MPGNDLYRSERGPGDGGDESIHARETLHPDDALPTARIAHEANRAFCAYLGDNSQQPWEAAPEWQHDSAINQVIFHEANPHAGDSAAHESWVKEKVDAGWVYGEVKNPDASPPTHPCILPFDQLPADQRFKDTLFRTIVHAALSA